MELNKLSFKEKYLAGKILIPKVKSFFDEPSKLYFFSLPWGDVSAAEKSFSIIKDYFNSSMADVEVTSPFEYQVSLSKEANALRVGSMIANDEMFSGNKNDLLSIVEALILYKNKNQLSWVSIGQFNLSIVLENNEVVPIITGTKTSLPGATVMGSLPWTAIGFEKHLQLNSGDSYLGDNQKIVIHTGVDAKIIDLQNSHPQNQSCWTGELVFES